MSKDCQNWNEKLRARYGVISGNDAPQSIVEDAFERGKSVQMAEWERDVKADMRAMLENAEWFGGDLDNLVALLCDKVAEEVEFNTEGDTYITDDVIVSTDNGIEVITTDGKWFTKCKLCSPCSPNAGDLSSPDEHGFKTICFEPAVMQEIADKNNETYYIAPFDGGETVCIQPK